MAKKLYPTDVLEQGRIVLDAWSQIKESLTFGTLSDDTLNADIIQARQLRERIINAENQLTSLRNQRDAAHQAVWEKVKRVRAGLKAIYGDDSSQYEMVGGTRLSERKTPVRRNVN